MLTVARARTAQLAACARRQVRSYYASSAGGSSSSSSSYGATQSGGYSAYSAVEPVAAASASYASPIAMGCPADAAIAPLDCMNRNARKPSPANHGARPNSSYNRKRSSPEFGSWRHAGLRPGQTPAPRPQPGTPACVAEVAVLGAAAAASSSAKPAAAATAESKSKKAAAATPQ